MLRFVHTHRCEALPKRDIRGNGMPWSGQFR